MTNPVLKVKKLNPNAVIPTRGSEKASGLDLSALENYTINANTTTLVQTGIAFGIPEGYEIQVRPRSGLSLKTGLRVANAPGTVDKDFTGECCVILWNTTGKDIKILKGDRIAQAVLCPVILPDVVIVDSLEETKRGENGFGSTDV
jgi:dUTP pyrophosphatase